MRTHLSYVQLCKLRVLTTSVLQLKIRVFVCLFVFNPSWQLRLSTKFSLKLLELRQQLRQTAGKSDTTGCHWLASRFGVVGSHTLGQAEIVFEICLNFSFVKKQVQGAHRLELRNQIPEWVIISPFLMYFACLADTLTGSILVL